MRGSLQYLSLAAGLTLALGMTACSDDDSGGPCGNGVIDSAEGEVCDGFELGGASCQSLGYTGGVLGCTDTCIYDESTCSDSCGDGVADAGEACDGDDHNGETCETLGEDPGQLTCMNNCTFNTSQCGAASVCGNGTLEGTEDCDLFELGTGTCVTEGFAGGDLSCAVDCTYNTMGCYTEAVMDVGSACEADSECDGGFCWTEVWPDRHWGQATGYCWERCDTNGGCPLSGAEGICITFGTGVNTIDRCMKRCDLVTPVCGVGQECTDGGGGQGFCAWGHCTSNADCVITGNCETDPSSDNFGWCTTPLEDCSNTIDDDFDGRIDCADPECTGETNCPIGENCGNGVDDEGDGAIDCADGECIDLGICTGEICTAPTGADLTCGTTLTGEANDQAGSTNVILGADCVDSENLPGGSFANEWGPEYAYRLTVTQPQEVTVTIDNYTGDLDIYIVKEVQGGCDPRQGCFAWGGLGAGVPEIMNFTAYPGMTYYVVVDGYNGNVSSYDITVGCASTGYEDCTNGTDDDGDTLIDCVDPECWGVSVCSTETDCGNGGDDDLDGAIDCSDNDCDTDSNCLPGAGYWELWERDGDSGEFDMEGQSLTFTVAANAQGYTFATATQATWLYTPGSGSVSTAAVTLDASDNLGGVRIDLPFSFPFDGTTHDSMYVIDNGYISFINEGGWMPGPTGWNVYQFPRIGPLWTDLDPTVGTVTYDDYGTYVVVTWDGLLFNEPGATTPNQFQLALHDSGDIEMFWLAVGDVANQPLWTEGMVTIVGAEIGTPPAQTNFLP